MHISDKSRVEAQVRSLKAEPHWTSTAVWLLLVSVRHVVLPKEVASPLYLTSCLTSSTDHSPCIR